MSIGKIRTGRKAGAIHREKIGEMQGRRQLNVMSKCEADPPMGRKTGGCEGKREGGERENAGENPVLSENFRCKNHSRRGIGGARMEKWVI